MSDGVGKRNEQKLTHVDATGRAAMVDVSAKPPMVRTATAGGMVRCAAATTDLLAAGNVPKGDVLAVARIAGIQAAKRTADLIPLCHQLGLDHVAVEFDVQPEAIAITATVRTRAATGVEMEALTAVAVAALTVYDMCKAVDRTMRIDGIRVLEKRKEAAPTDHRDGV
ncbi:MAG: Cyclic pyranopterin monophosphate synthase 2 [Phycisphaerae bacterium]|nr:Cyclic pyranopterin monophosphate synthase 2 [Phycisphaerae bacterium]